MASILEILNYHKMDRRLYEKILGLGRLANVARNIVALWMMLEFMSIDVIYCVKDIAAPILLLDFVMEAEAILNVIRPGSSSSDNDELIAIPLTANFANEPIDLLFFSYHSDVVVRGLTYILDGVGTLIFNDELNQMLLNYERTLSFSQQQGLRSPVIPEELSRQYNSRVTPSLEDHRSLFITFSRGFPLRREEIMAYFNERLGECVERVMMERTPIRATPMYGRIIFTSDALIDILLNGERVVKFVINGRHVWGRKYIPRTNRIS
ncbi:hypothetical protein IHE45_05G153600 [Dioscorea alata]|uniref:Uncharacterized protein n=1 Tax=Dioscorea alata TaxID=55571 RepID=A0ACB7W5V0_DIOAL|nr:hypothetical protein IHE45_05G153600 [Dioscorea alata]